MKRDSRTPAPAAKAQVRRPSGRSGKLRPGDVEAARRLGQTLETRGDPRAAAIVLEKAVARATRDPDLLADLGYARLSAGDAAGARQAFERALALRPADSVIRRPLAHVYESLGKPAQAAATLAAIPAEAASPRVLGDLARLCLGLERYREAEEAFQALGTRDPEHALLAQHGLTLCRIKRGDWRGALDVALTATRLDRFDLTTAFLAYAKDRLFHRVPDAEQREAALTERLLRELREHDHAHAEDEGGGAGSGQEEIGG